MWIGDIVFICIAPTAVVDPSAALIKLPDIIIDFFSNIRKILSEYSMHLIPWKYAADGGRSRGD